eukprot:scaffold22574_cov125-Cylindrotheca_fusiformis.AAC.1
MMTENHPPHSRMDVWTPDYFHHYDSLGHDAANLDDATEALRVAKQELDDTEQQLKDDEKEMEKLRSIIKEETDRIELVSTHWFYGTTLFQPQLWFRGGCTGKIRRAEAKLKKARDEDLPVRLSSVEDCQTRLPNLLGVVEEGSLQFEVSANAASERQAMKARVILENPSSEIVRLQSEESTAQGKLRGFNSECEVLDEITVQLVNGQEQYNMTNRLLKQALAHKQKCNELRNQQVTMARPSEVLQAKHQHESFTETRMPTGTRSVVVRRKQDPIPHVFLVDRRNNILMTNFPCPSGCGYLITSHDSHCCHSCVQGNGHAWRCQRKPLNTQEGAQAKLDHWNQQRIAHTKALSSQEDASKRKFNKARNDAISIERRCAEALRRIPLTIRERYPAFCGFVGSTTSVVSHGSSESVQQEMERVNRSQSLLAEHLSAVEHITTRTKAEAAEMEERLSALQSLEELENTRIFNQIRSQVFHDHGSSSLPPPRNPAYMGAAESSSLPSAPTEEQVLTSSVVESNDNDLSQEFAVARGVEPVQAEAPVLVSFEKSQEDTSIPMASAMLW